MDYTLVFDGGSIGNPGPGYGSFRLIRNAGGRKRTKRLDFGPQVTNNQAEYRALIAGLAHLVAMIERAGKSPGDYSVAVQGDSRLVVNQMTGQWKVRDADLKPLHEQALALYRRFHPASTIAWHERAASVRVLGH
jgi:probable phosphoglycerate mutase